MQGQKHIYHLLINKYLILANYFQHALVSCTRYAHTRTYIQVI